MVCPWGFKWSKCLLLFLSLSVLVEPHADVSTKLNILTVQAGHFSTNAHHILFLCFSIVFREKQKLLMFFFLLSGHHFLAWSSGCFFFDFNGWQTLYGALPPTTRMEDRSRNEHSNIQCTSKLVCCSWEMLDTYLWIDGNWKVFKRYLLLTVHCEKALSLPSNINRVN